MSLVVVRVYGLCTVQDLGRRGHMHEAVPPGGALVPALLVAANRAVGNADDAPAIEILGQLVVRANAPILVGTLDGPRALRAGEELIVESGALRCAYLALHGGVDAPVVLDGRGTLLCAELGRVLRAGATATCASSAARDRWSPSRAAPPASSAHAVHAAVGDVTRDDGVRRLCLIPGPDLDAFPADALARLASGPYRILPTSDRVGTRLAGPAIPRVTGYRERSRPMVIGALEVPADGQPIVLGPEHPTTGGYPIIAVIATAELGRFFATRLGGEVEFVV